MGIQVVETPSSSLSRNYAIAHDRLLKAVENLTDAQVGRSMGIHVHSVGWQLWHVTRWDDRFADVMVAAIPEMAERLGDRGEIWIAENLGGRWGLPVGKMGRRDTGTELDDEAADRLMLPDKETLLNYARRVFARADLVVAAIPGDKLFTPAPGDPDGDIYGDTYAQNIMEYLDHVQRHLGMIEALRGLQDVRGSASGD